MKYALCSGGIGDALIGIAEAKITKNLVIHAANRGNRDVVSAFYEAFEVPAIIFNGAFVDLKNEYKLLVNNPDCVSTSHLPKDMLFDNWADRITYERKIVNKMDVQSFFPSQKGNYIIVAPFSSSESKSFNIHELCRIVVKYSCPVYIVCDAEQQINYGIIKENNIFYMDNEGITNREQKFKKHTTKDMLAIINGARLVISSDTWVKTYAHYAGIETIVIKKTKKTVADNIFLNTRIWDFKVVDIKDII